MLTFLALTLIVGETGGAGRKRATSQVQRRNGVSARQHEKRAKSMRREHPRAPTAPSPPANTPSPSQPPAALPGALVYQQTSKHCDGARGKGDQSDLFKARTLPNTNPLRSWARDCRDTWRSAPFRWLQQHPKKNRSPAQPVRTQTKRPHT